MKVRLATVLLLAGVLLCALGVALRLPFPVSPVSRDSNSASDAAATPHISTVPLEKIGIARARQTRTADAAAYWPQTPHPVELKSRTLLPGTTFPPGQPLDASAVWIVQFGGPVDDAARARLKNAGVTLLLPSTANAWHARATPHALSRAMALKNPALLGWAELKSSDRILSNAGAALDRGAREMRLELYPQADLATLKAALIARRIDVLSAETRAIAVALPADASTEMLEAVANLDGVYVIDVPRPRKAPTNESAAADSKVNVVAGPPYNLNGSGLTVMVRDEGRIFAHPDFGGRLLFGPDVASQSPAAHATHVAGTIGGTGQLDVAALARGMAVNVQLASYDLNGDDVGELLDARTRFGALLSSHAYGFVIGWEGSTFNKNQALFGDYGSFARDWDTIARANTLVIVKSVGNDRNDSGAGFPHDGVLGADGEFYACVEPGATGKNYLVVGAAADGVQAGVPVTSTAVIAGSSAGPCDDGRLKPDFIANGDNVHSCNNSTTPGSEYQFLSGTSMSTGVATGAAALLIQRYWQITGTSNVPPVHWLRTLIAQTATDMGRAGPDYLHGFGMLDASAAIALLDADAGGGTRIFSSDVSGANPERFFVFNSDGVTPVRITVSWTDSPGDVLAAKALVNDLDLKVIRVDDRTEFLPYTLDPAQPHLPAARGINNVDNIEQLEFTPAAPGAYAISVRGTVLSEATPFTLAASQAFAVNLAPVAQIVSSNTVGNPPLTASFSGASAFDPDGAIVRYVWDFGDGTGTEGSTVQHTYALGSFTARLTVIDNAGGSSSASVIVAVSNEAPLAVAAASPSSGAPPLNVLFSGADSSDSDGVIVSYAWDFGDGTSGTGESTAHTYTAPGVYFVTLTVKDNGASIGTTTMVVLCGENAAVASGNFSLNFRTSGRDSIKLMTRTQLVPPDLVTPAGLTGVVYIGTGAFPFELDDRGRFKMAPLQISLSARQSRFTVILRRTILSNFLANAGAISKDTRNEVLYIPFAISLSNGTFAGSTGIPFNYSARQGSSGRGRLLKP
jgi:PKD repeat protein